MYQQTVLWMKRLLEAFRWQNNEEPNLSIYATYDRVSQNTPYYSEKNTPFCFAVYLKHS